jgi:tetratricopeptide (TPR) repeat protein
VRDFAERAGAQGTRAGRRVKGLALERFAILTPEPLAGRARAEAARARIVAGDPVGARRVLDAIAGDRGASSDVRRLAEVQLVRAFIAAGDLAAAAERIARADGGPALHPGERAELRMALARARMARGALDAAERTVAADSSVEATALRGWIALYAGRLDRAHALLLAAGPYASGADEATHRVVALALLEQVGVDEAPLLGAALRELHHGDSTRAVPQLARAGRAMPRDAGRQDVLLLAGRVAARLGAAHDSTAMALFDEVVRLGGDDAAPAAAELEWAHVLLRANHAEAAIVHLERLILAYPESAVVPLARRALDRARGAVPRS